MKFISRDRTKVLNFGCGTGLLESQLRHDVKECVGIDISAGMIERMQHKIDNEKWENVSIQVNQTVLLTKVKTMILCSLRTQVRPENLRQL